MRQTHECNKPMESNSRKKFSVLGGNGYLGTHICREALSKGIPVVSLSRSGRPGVAEPWCNDVEWVKGDLFQPSNWRNTLRDVSAVISCVGEFGSNEQMQKINGVANVQAIQAAAEAGVKRFVYISVHDFGFAVFCVAGKRAAEDELLKKFPYSGVILRPGFIHGVRQVGRGSRGSRTQQASTCELASICTADVQTPKRAQTRHRSFNALDNTRRLSAQTQSGLRPTGS